MGKGFQVRHGFQDYVMRCFVLCFFRFFCFQFHIRRYGHVGRIGIIQDPDGSANGHIVQRFFKHAFHGAQHAALPETVYAPAATIQFTIQECLQFLSHNSRIGLAFDVVIQYRLIPFADMVIRQNPHQLHSIFRLNSDAVRYYRPFQVHIGGRIIIYHSYSRRSDALIKAGGNRHGRHAAQSLGLGGKLAPRRYGVLAFCFHINFRQGIAVQKASCKIDRTVRIALFCFGNRIGCCHFRCIRQGVQLHILAGIYFPRNIHQRFVIHLSYRDRRDG